MSRTTKIAPSEIEMTENEKLCAMYADGLIEREDVPPSCWHKPRKHRKPKPPSLTSAIRKAKAEGVVLTVEPSGAMTFKTSSEHRDLNSEEGTVTALEQWRAKRRGQG